MQNAESERGIGMRNRNAESERGIGTRNRNAESERGIGTRNRNAESERGNRCRMQNAESERRIETRNRNAESDAAISYESPWVNADGPLPREARACHIKAARRIPRPGNRPTARHAACHPQRTCGETREAEQDRRSPPGPSARLRTAALSGPCSPADPHA